MLEKLGQIWRVRDLRKKVLFVFAMLVVFRVVAHIPVPGVDPDALKNFFGSNQLLGLLNVFSGGGLENFSVVMLGVGPYITASIIFQLLTMIIPALERLQKEGEQGYQKINQWTRLLAVPLAVLQAFSTITLLRQQGQGIIPSMSTFEFVTAVVVITGGTMFLMWIGELITEQKIGNGISLLIFAGIVASIPTSLQQTIAVFDSTKIFTYALIGVVGLITIAAIVFITEAQRNIPVSYARRIRGNQAFGGVDTHLPLRVNQAGVIPIIFAVSLVVFPPLVAQFFSNSAIGWLATAARQTIVLFQNQIFYAAIYFFLVVAFTYFYTTVVFHPQQIAENLQKQGGFIPGIRPGQNTAEYLRYVSNRIMLAGALFLGAVAVLPNILQSATNLSTLVVGGTSLLIVVAVVIETVKQIDAQLVMRDYEGF
ncbi:MAG: preprotein translocase subunit SecY [Candidatus Kerfeldbacteria bacterium]|nr:preprotein translocase subunit SecY [Candidatus Kerfeldbacteria bacterium]